MSTTDTDDEVTFEKDEPGKENGAGNATTNGDEPPHGAKSNGHRRKPGTDPPQGVTLDDFRARAPRRSA